MILLFSFISNCFLISFVISSVTHWLFKSVLFNFWGFPGGSVVKNLPAKAGDTRDMGSVPVSGTVPGVGNGNPLQYSWLENPMDRGAWWPTVNGVTKGWIWLSTAQHLISTYLWIFQISLWCWNLNSFWFLISCHWITLS